MNIPNGATHKWSASGQFAKRCGGNTWAIWQDHEWLWIGDEFKGEMQPLFDAAQVRKAAIEEIIKDLRMTNGNGWYSIAEDLYDKGYRKFEIVEEDV